MRTKIIATIGPASNSRETLSQLITAGVRIFRLNFSHGDASAFVDIVKNLRDLEGEHGVPLTLMQDLAGPKIRIGTLKDDAPITVTKGDILLLGPKESFTEELPYLPFNNQTILAELLPGDRLVLADGSLQFRVIENVEGSVFRLEASNNGMVTSRKGLTLPGKSIRLPALTEKDKKNLVDGLALGIDAVALSYVQTPKDIIEAKAIIKEQGKNVPVVAKLERRNAVERLDAILEEADVIMVARGDLGVECSLAELPAMQKRIIRACNRASKPVIVATQMLLSMVSSPQPTRAETTDVANAVLDGADCVMLSEETAMGAYPVETVAFMADITTRAEEFMAEVRTPPQPTESNAVASLLAYSACRLAEKTSAKGIVVHTMSGSSGRLIAALKPRCAVYAVTKDEQTSRGLNFSWGVTPRVLPSNTVERHLERAESFINQATEFKEGDDVIITASQESRPEAVNFGTNVVKIYRK